MDRRTPLIAAFGAAKIDALLVTSLKNIRYLTGFTGSAAQLLVEPNRTTIFTDPRYDIQVREQVDCQVSVSSKPARALETALKRRAIRRLGFEASHARFADYARWKESLPATVRLTPTNGLVEALRAIKLPEEVEAIRRAVTLNSAAFEAAVKQIRLGMTERDLAAEIDHQMRLLGADGAAFDTIVAAGANSALPHAQPGAKPLEGNELLLIDMGAQVEGYASDMTRVLHLGEPNRRTKQLYRSVLDAQLAAINAVRDGVQAGAVDRAARSRLADQQLDQFFTHSTGHGLGLDIHEFPRLANGEKTILRTGMVVTVEPGVYQAGRGGIRIEDTVLVTGSGCEVLTTTPKELLVV